MNETGYQTIISAGELKAIWENQQVVLLDCRYYLIEPDRGRREYLQAHIPGAHYLDIGLDLSGPVLPGITGRHPLPDPQVLESTLQQCGINSDSQVVAYDQLNGAYAVRAWWLLRWLGHVKVAVLDGGFAAWKAAGYQVDNVWPPPAKGNFTMDVRDQLIVSKEEIQHPSFPLIDSREYERYTGQREPIDPIAGHIPGAICMPYLDNIHADGTWRSKEELKQKFSAIQSNPFVAPVFYCGSGVTACHNILAYKIATGADARLYPGSWSEWIQYYPAETGPQ
jgi:thiosulfate/3-mercaptopyruvate sulfurtransferase